jgi:hypothetical protein
MHNFAISTIILTAMERPRFDKNHVSPLYVRIMK